MKKKIIPVVIAIGLIIIILAVGVGKNLFDKYFLVKFKNCAILSLNTVC